MYLILSIFISLLITYALFFIGNFGIVLGIGILAGILFRIVFLMESINKHLVSQHEPVNDPLPRKL